MTIAVLRRLQAIIGQAIDDIERVYASHGSSVTSESTSSRDTAQTLSSQNCGSDNEETVSIPECRPLPSTPNSQAYVSPPPSPSTATSSHPIPPSITTPTSSTNVPVDFPSLDAPCNPTSLSETLTTHPVVLDAIGRIVAAAGQMSATVQVPFLTLCDATMGYHLQSCMRLLEASHVAEILREAGPAGLHVDEISKKNGVQATKLAHTLRLLATHHILREVSPDVFTLNRISSLVDSGKTFSELKKYQEEGSPEMKYRDAGGIAAFVGLCTDEIQKASAYMTETYYLSPSQEIREGREPVWAPFCFAFDTVKTRTGFFGWLEGEVESKDGAVGASEDEGVEIGQGGRLPPTLGKSSNAEDRSIPELSRPVHKASRILRKKSASPTSSTDSESLSTVKNDGKDKSNSKDKNNSNRFRLERFGKAMSGSEGWETPGAVLNGFDWGSLPPESVVVDVGGGIGSTSMLLASAFSSSGSDSGEAGPGLQFIIQDRPVVCEMGEKAWEAKCPELLNSNMARFQVHDFFTPQPVRNAAVFLLRCVLHDWPNGFARQILLRLREAAMPETKLIIADFVLPLACHDDTGNNDGLEGAESILPPAPLLPNLGKASANVYWMDLTMQVMFNSQERTLREMVNLTSSAGWKIVKVTKTPGSLFGYLVAIPVPIPAAHETEEEPVSVSDQETSEFGRETSVPVKLKTELDKSGTERKERQHRDDMQMIERSSSRCGTPTFGSNTRLSSVDDALARFGSGIIRQKAMGRSISTPSGAAYTKPPPPKPTLKPALSLASAKKKKPSPLSVPPLHPSPSRVYSHSPSQKPVSTSPRHVEHSHSSLQFPSPSQAQTLSPAPRIIARRMSLANLRSPSQNLPPPPPLLTSVSQPPPPPSPLSPLFTQMQAQVQTRTPMRRRASHAQLSQVANGNSWPVPPMPSLIPVPVPVGTDSPSFVSNSRGAVGSPSTHAPVRYRRPSNAQIPQQLSLRKRSGTVVGNSSGERLSGISGLSVSGPGAVLTFDPERRHGHRRQLSMSPSTSASNSVRSHSPAVGSVSVLAAAARIERRELIQPPLSP